MSSEPILRVAVPAPLRHTLDYLPPDGESLVKPAPGMRIIVPLGARQVMGIIVEILPRSNLEPRRLRRAIALPDTGALLPPDILQLSLWAAQYYHAPLGEAVINTLPSALRQTKRPARKQALQWQPTQYAAGLASGALPRSPRQAEALKLLLERGRLRASELKAAGVSRAALKGLEAKGLATSIADEDSEPLAMPGVSLPTMPQLPLNPAQQTALDSIESRLDGFCCFLLEGITGSGKTEVYLRLIDKILARGQQALVLVPEIGLTPQARRRFTERFAERIAVLHSGLSDNQRLQAWENGANGHARVLIGTRSALFSPLPELGAIIVDEEHDSSFKQQEGFRYSARDLAIYRARMKGVPIVLGSATPSPESLANVQNGRFVHLTLPERAGKARPPTLQLIDIRAQPLEGGLSRALLARMETELRAGNQVLVFLNRRGWAPVFSCGDCGWMAACRDCDARLTMHRERGLLWCHHCDFKQPVPDACPGCHSMHLMALGTGTERSEHTLQRLFPDYPIHRIDRGTMQARDAMDALIARLEVGEPCILVGTQMLAKGHHFPAVTLVAIVDIDGGLFSADLRAAERTGQLLIQVAGRAGRAEKPGEVLIQTLHPTHPWLERLVHGGYRAFIDPIMQERQRLGLPPYGHMALLRAESREHDSALQMLQRLKRNVALKHREVGILGPVPATMQRRAGRHRLQLLFTHGQRAVLHAALDSACQFLESQRLTGIERWSLDVDPVEGA